LEECMHCRCNRSISDIYRHNEPYSQRLGTGRPLSRELLTIISSNPLWSVDSRSSFRVLDWCLTRT
jgi:hypothetical protein